MSVIDTPKNIFTKTGKTTKKSLSLSVPDKLMKTKSYFYLCFPIWYKWSKRVKGCHWQLTPLKIVPCYNIKPDLENWPVLIWIRLVTRGHVDVSLIHSGIDLNKAGDTWTRRRFFNTFWPSFFRQISIHDQTHIVVYSYAWCIHKISFYILLQIF